MINNFSDDLYQDQAQQLVKVFTTASDFEALLVQGLLEWAGIENVLTWLDPLPRSVHPTGAGAMIRVLECDVSEALALIEEYRNGQLQFELDPDFEGPVEAN